MRARFAFLLAALWTTCGCAPLQGVGRLAAEAEHRNVILLIGDGLGASSLTVARNYHAGAGGRLAFDALPYSGWCTTYAVREDDPQMPDYVTDSASSATAIATGRKTSNRRVSTAPAGGEPMQTILQRARAAGYRTGIVTTSSVNDATPAAFGAHVNFRWCHGPQMMAECPTFSTAFGGLGSIAEQLVATRPDVLLGGGEAAFLQRIPGGTYAGRSVIEKAAAAGYWIVRDGDELRSSPPDTPLLGLFADGDLTPMWERSRAAFPHDATPIRCREAQRPGREPALVDMLEVALARLSDPTTKSPGFFLMVEGAMIDKRAHAADLCGHIGDTIEFDRAVATARAFAERHPGTLVIVVGDHDHTPQIVDPLYARVNPGITTTVQTNEGATMSVAYATSFTGFSQQHTGAQLPIAAFGPGAEKVRGLVDHTDVYRIMATALGLAEHATQSD